MALMKRKTGIQNIITQKLTEALKKAFLAPKMFLELLIHWKISRKKSPSHPNFNLIYWKNLFQIYGPSTKLSFQ